MTSAIEFLKACQELCHKRKSCKGCPVGEACDGACYEFAMVMSDELITNLVRAVMAEVRKKEGGDEDEEAGDHQS